MLRAAAALVVFLVSTAVAAQAASQAYPSRPIRMIVPFAPGGTNELLARLIGQKFQEAWGQPVIPENRPGAGGNIGADAVAKSAPDGYTLLFGTNTLTMNAFIVKQMPFDVQADLAPVAMVATTPFIVVVNNDLPVRSIAELIAYARANPGKLSFGTPGNGTPHHLGTEMFKTMAGVDMVHVPYKGSTNALTDVMTGNLQLMWVTINVGMPLVKAGKLRAIGIGEPRRSATYRDLPAIAETLPGYEVTAWYAVFAPAGTPQPIVAQLSTELARIFRLPEVRERLVSTDVEVTVQDAAQLRATVASDMARWRKVVADAGLQRE
jgi:tripartite-type tricarboxylate transporter receptor subunit TctC